MLSTHRRRCRRRLLDMLSSLVIVVGPRGIVISQHGRVRVILVVDLLVGIFPRGVS